MRSIVCNPSKTKWKHHEVMYVINPNRKNIQVLRLDDKPFASQTDYILAYARLHTNPSNWITKKERRFFFVLFCVGIALFSRAASSQVFSALMSLTSVFGMGTGGPSPPMTPTTYIIH